MADGTRLFIDLNNWTIQVEGDAELAREVYQDFKERLAEAPASAAEAEPAQEAQGADGAPAKRVSKKSGSKKRGSKTSTASKGTADDQIKPDHELDLSGLQEFYDQYEPKNNGEKVLIFASFLRDRLGKDPFTASELYTCFWSLQNRSKVPTAFGQNLRNVQSRQGFIAVNSLDDIRLTTRGINHLHHELKRVAAE